MTLAEKLLALRTERGLSQEELAEKLAVSRQSVSKWETGQSVPDLDKIIRLADLFAVSVDELVREGERPQPPPPEEPKVVYITEKRSLTGAQKTGVILETAGLILLLLGLAAGAVLSLIGGGIMALGLPLLLAKKHPWLWLGWVAVAAVSLFLNPYTSVAPWGLIGGLRYLYHYLTVPELHYATTLFAALAGISRGALVLLLTALGIRAWRKGRQTAAETSPPGGETPAQP